MWLRYGVSADGALISIEDVPKGKTRVRCPYCQECLTAKKGNIKEHHFAHTEKTCRSVERPYKELPILPLYDTFNLQLSGQEIEQLRGLWREYGAKNYGIPQYVVPARFIYRRLLQESRNSERQGYEFTPLGKIPLGALSLKGFQEVQHPLLLKKLSELEQKAERAKLLGLSTFSELFTDLEIYRAHLSRIFLHSLYFLRTEVDGQTLYKIGITTRSVEERVKEVQSDLRSHFTNIKIEVLGTWSHRGNVEKYFKYRYRNFHYPLGRLTEYFTFKDENALVVLRDLERMKPQEFSPLDMDLLEGQEQNSSII
ncbi:MAG: GIY-YIG nuclease family protein [Brasilonema angustatum HA4187-MV1]|jgi:hypothetical protein|nr:GIY-YIG nuclease family protein [Brasilonema angustatum HA4187-MV1]